MNKIKCAIVALSLICGSTFADQVQSGSTSTMPSDCSTMGADMQQFAAQLTVANKAIFCSKFSDSQRATAMQYASQQGTSGTLMTADQAVQKVASDNKMTPTQKTPTGCPVK